MPLLLLKTCLPYERFGFAWILLIINLIKNNKLNLREYQNKLRLLKDVRPRDHKVLIKQKQIYSQDTQTCNIQKIYSNTHGGNSGGMVIDALVYFHSAPESVLNNNPLVQQHISYSQF